MKSKIKHLVIRSAAIVYCLLLVINVAAFQGSWELGSYGFITSGQPGPPLQYDLASSGGLGSYNFVSGVGGVAFAGMAEPNTEIAQQKIHLRYDASLPDGQRLRVFMASTAVQTDLPDWMLIPIAKYADSKFDSCVSLFGPKTTKTQYDIVYHQEFQNTLLGLRLMQADILLFNLGETWQLPTFNGRVVLGAGEKVPTQMDRQAAIQIDHAISDTPFQSWVMTDQGEQIVFSNDQGRLQITGAPYYYFWTADVESTRKLQDAMYQRALAARKAGNVAEHNRIVSQVNSMVPKVQEVTVLTARLRAQRDALRRFNQPVYDAATRTMQYAAFFRYIRRQDPEAWSAFIQQLRFVNVGPQITTPDKWKR